MNISFINASTAVTDAEAQQVMTDLQTQVDRDFMHIWGNPGRLLFVGKGQKPKAETWWLSLLDNSDQAGALGYHDLTTAGNPIGKAFVKTCQQYGVSWTVDASHELLEMLVDPYIGLCVQDAQGSRLYAYEVGDPVQDDSCGYKIGNTLVSDFVLPAFFEPERTGKANQFSFGKHLSAPLTLARGGYMSYMDITSAQGWQQITADLQPLLTRSLPPSIQHRAMVGSRRERRRTPRNQWILSTVECD